MKNTISGWQSWTPCHPVPNIFDLLSRHFYSPFGQNEWKIPNNNKAGQSKPIAGWCSFYSYGHSINEQNILSNAKILADKISPPMDTYIVVDDGWCNWGDWSNPNPSKFPHGLSYLTNQIRSMGLKPGVWIAPFLSNTPTPYRLKVFPFNFIQDLENPQIFRKAIDSIKILIEKYNFEYLKLDFLYALHHLTRYTSSKTPDEILSKYLSTIRSLYPHVHFNLCGCPLGPAVGNCDSMRISADIISPFLDNIWPLNSFFHTHRLNQLDKNIINRENTRNLWLLDPDIYTCRNSTGLSHAQKILLRNLIRKANGLYFLGDDLTQLTSFQIDTYVLPLFKDL